MLEFQKRNIKKTCQENVNVFSMLVFLNIFISWKVAFTGNFSGNFFFIDITKRTALAFLYAFRLDRRCSDGHLVMQFKVRKSVERVVNRNYPPFAPTGTTQRETYYMHSNSIPNTATFLSDCDTFSAFVLQIVASLGVMPPAVAGDTHCPLPWQW